MKQKNLEMNLIANNKHLINKSEDFSIEENEKNSNFLDKDEIELSNSIKKFDKLNSEISVNLSVDNSINIVVENINTNRNDSASSSGEMSVNQEYSPNYFKNLVFLTIFFNLLSGIYFLSNYKKIEPRRIAFLTFCIILVVEWLLIGIFLYSFLNR